MINDFEFLQPRALPEALDALAGKDRVMPLAGGTNILVNMKRAPLDVDFVLDLSQVPALDELTDLGDTVRLGGGLTFAQLLEWRPGGAVEALMRPMCAAFAGPLIRNLATLGGNLCDASPAADVSPALLALDASVELDSQPGGRRVLGLAEFFKGVRKTARRQDELLTGVTFPNPGPEMRAYYYKLGKRKADAISIVSTAITLSLKGNIIEVARIALGAVAPVAIRAHAAEAELIGQELSERAISKAAATAAKESSPIDDFRASADYRRNMVEALVSRGLHELKQDG